MLESVSYHAVIRYLERVLGLPVAEWLAGADHLNDHGKAMLCCERAGLPVAAVRQSILSKPILAAMRAGFNEVIVRYDGFAYVIRQGGVITIVTERMREERHGRRDKLKQKTKVSTRRDFAKANRRNKAKHRRRQIAEVE